MVAKGAVLFPDVKADVEEEVSGVIFSSHPIARA